MRLIQTPNSYANYVIANIAAHAYSTEIHIYRGEYSYPRMLNQHDKHGNYPGTEPIRLQFTGQFENGHYNLIKHNQNYNPAIAPRNRSRNHLPHYNNHLYRK
jgi:hypothetical protein